MLHWIFAILVCSSFLCEEIYAWTTTSAPLKRESRAPLSSPQSDNGGVTIEEAMIPQDLEGIRECRRTVDFAKKVNLLSSEISFLEATALVPKDMEKTKKKRSNVRCVVAREKLSGPGKSRIVGTADCRIGMDGRRILVNNVYVRPDQRGKGLGKRLMVEGVEQLVANRMDATTLSTSAAPLQKKPKLSLTVYTQNKPAVALYKNCGYKPDNIVGTILMAISEITGLNLFLSMCKEAP